MEPSAAFSFNKEPPHTHKFLFITPMSSVTNPLDDLKPQEDPAQLDIEEDDDVEETILRGTANDLLTVEFEVELEVEGTLYPPVPEVVDDVDSL